MAMKVMFQEDLTQIGGPEKASQTECYLTWNEKDE